LNGLFDIINGLFEKRIYSIKDIINEINDDNFENTTSLQENINKGLSIKEKSLVNIQKSKKEIIDINDIIKEFIENTPENPHINYLRNPIAGIRELERLMDVVEKGLADIHSPALVVQSQQDPVVDPKGSRKAFEKISSDDKQYILFNFKRHGIVLGKGSDRVHRMIGAFVRDIDKINKGKTGRYHRPTEDSRQHPFGRPTRLI